jgi:synaptotagmin-4
VSHPLASSGFKTFLVFLVISVVPAVLGLTLAAILAVAACFCARRVRRQNKKSNAEAAAFPFQPAPRPTRAVRSPNGLASHYLKKSPSPTSIKPLPGAQSPTTDPLPPQTTTTKYSAENEITKSIVNSELRSPGDQDQVDDGEYGKLGTLVFKLRFLVERSALVVSVVRCRGLPTRGNLAASADASNIGQLQANGKTISATATDPYVKLQLLPDKQHKVKTR